MTRIYANVISQENKIALKTAMKKKFIAATRKVNMYFNRLVPTKRRPVGLNALAMQRLKACSYVTSTSNASFLYWFIIQQPDSKIFLIMDAPDDPLVKIYRERTLKVVALVKLISIGRYCLLYFHSISERADLNNQSKKPTAVWIDFR